VGGVQAAWAEPAAGTRSYWAASKQRGQSQRRAGESATGRVVYNILTCIWARS